jgi:hypothetical protein
MSEIKLLTRKNLALKYVVLHTIYFCRGKESAKWMQLSMLSLNKKMTPPRSLLTRYMSVYCPEMLLAINPTLLSAFRQVLRA